MKKQQTNSNPQANPAKSRPEKETKSNLVVFPDPAKRSRSRKVKSPQGSKESRSHSANQSRPAAKAAAPGSNEIFDPMRMAIFAAVAKMEARPAKIELLTPEELSEKIKVPVDTLSLWRFAGKGPAYFQVSDEFVRYDMHDVRKWLNGSLVSSGKEA